MPEQVIVTSPEELMKKLSEPAVLPPPPAPSPRKVESPEELQRTMDWGAADFVLSENPVMPVPEHLAVEVPQPSVLGSRYYTVPPRGEWGRMGEMGFLESIGRMNPEEKIPWIGLGADIGRLLLARAAADRVSKAQAAGKDVFKDRAFDEDLDTLRNTWLLHQYESARGQSWAGLGAEVLSEIPSFLVEMWASGGIAGAARVGAKKAVRKVVGNGLLRTAGQTGAGLLASGGARLATVGVPRVVKGYIERKNPQAVFDSAYKVRIEESKETHVSALYKAVGDTFIEYLSEESGEILGKLGGRAVRRLAAKSPKFAALNNAIRKAWSKVPGNKPSGWGQRLKKVGWHGIVEEMGEERLGDVLRSVLRVEDKTLGEALIPTGKQFMAELMSFGVMGGGFAGAGQVRQSVRTRRYRKALLSDGGAGAWALHNWEKAADLVDGESSSRKAFEAAGLPKMSGEERAAFLDQVTGFLRAAVEPAPATGQSGVEPEALAVDLTPEEMLRQQMEGAQQRIEGATARVRAEREGREEAEAQTEEKRQAIRDEFETLIGDSLDLEADLHRAFSEGDLDKAQELNSALVGMHQKARERFSGLDLSQLAQPIDPAMFVMQEAGQKTRDERRKAKEPGPEPAPQGYTRKQLNSKSRTFLAGLAKSRGIANPGSMNRTALIRALLKTPAAKPVEKPAPAPEPVKSKGLKPEAELNSLREQIQRAQEVLEEKPQFSGNKSFMARLAKLQDRYAELEAQQGRAPAEKPEAPESTAKWAAGIPVEKAKEPAGEDQGLAGEEAGSQETVRTPRQPAPSDEFFHTDAEVVRAPVSEIKIDSKRFQYKIDTDEEGVRDRLEGPWDDRVSGIVLLWQAKNGDTYVVNGHHRIELAKREGVKDIRAVVVREADGVTPEDARLRGAIENIKSGRGTTADAAEMWRLTDEQDLEVTEKEYGGNPKQTHGYKIGRHASDQVYDLWRRGNLGDSQAAAIASAVPGNEADQRSALEYVKDMPEATASDIRRFIEAGKYISAQPVEVQAGLFAGDTDFQYQQELQRKVAKQAAKKIAELRSRRATIRGATRIDQSKVASEYGIKVKSDQDLNALEEALDNEIDKLEHYWTDPELVKELQEQASGGQGDLFDQKQDQKEPGGGASGNAMAAAVTSSLNVLPRNPDAIQDDRPKTKSRGRKTPPVSEPAAPGEAEETLGARFKRAMKTNTLVDGILHLLSPAHRGVALPGQEDAPALQVAKIKAASVAEMHRKDLVVAKLLHDAEKASSIKFRKMTNAEVADFVHAIETGQSLDIPELQVLADTLRNLLDEGRTQLQAIGKLQEFYENYFPHLFKDARKARDPIVAALSKRHLKPSGFLKQRKYLTVKEAMESNPDLELAHWNPLLIVAMHLHQVHRHLADHQIVQQLKARGLARFVAASLTKSYAPAGWVAVDDPSTQVVASPEISVQEAYDQLLADQLKGVLASLGITHERMATLGRPNLWGLSMTGQPRIKTKFAGPLSVLGHELGHQIGDIFGLYEYMRTGEHTQGKVIEKGKYKGQRSKSDAQKKRGNIDREFRALARLRAEGHDGQISEARLRYLMKQAEKEAVILEAWLAAPEKMERVAPEITKAWKEFLSAHERLKPLLHLNRSVVLGTASTTHKLPGVLNLGRWYVPAEVGTILENYLSPGFRGYKIAAVGSTYEWLRFVGAAMNQASLALSGFHAINVSTDAINTQMGLGFQQLFRLQLSKGLKNVVQSPLAPGTALMAGRKLLKAVQTPLNEIADPQMREMVEALVQAGGRAKMDPMYHNQMLQGLTTTMRELTVEGAGNKATAAVKLPFQTIFGAIELAAWPIMQYQVPALKLGCFQLLAKDIYAEAERKGWSDARRQGELMSAWSSVDNRMGQMTYDNLNWHRMLKEASMLVLRSAGWNLGSLREFGGALFVDLPSTPARILRGDDIITRRMGYAVGAGISYALQGALITYLLTGLWPWDDDDEEDTLSERLKDYYFPKTGNVNPDGTAERLGLPTYSRDIFSWFTRPWTTLKHKLHPLWGTIADLISNEDYYGTEIRDVKDPLPQQLIDMASHIGESFIPFSVRNYFRFREAGESRTQAFLQGASGITSAPKYITETPARKLLSEIAASKRSRGSRSKEKAEYYRRRTQAIRGLRSGQKVDLSGFTSDQIKDIQRESKLTQLQSSFKRLSLEDAVRVFHLANAEERMQLFDLLLDKRVRTTSADDDVMQAYYALRLSQGEIDARRKADQQAAGKDLLRLSVAQRKGEPEELYLQRLAEIKGRLKKNPEFDLDKHAVRALMRAAVKGSRFKTTMRAAAKGSRFKTTRMYRGLKLTPFGKLVRRAERALGL